MQRIDWSLVIILAVVLCCATVLTALSKLDAAQAMPVFSGIATGIFALAMPRTGEPK